MLNNIRKLIKNMLRYGFHFNQYGFFNLLKNYIINNLIILKMIIKKMKGAEQ